MGTARVSRSPRKREIARRQVSSHVSWRSRGRDALEGDTHQVHQVEAALARQRDLGGDGESLGVVHPGEALQGVRADHHDGGVLRLQKLGVGHALCDSSFLLLWPATDICRSGSNPAPNFVKILTKLLGNDVGLGRGR